ncbi:hypothetical protein GH714_040821 [Hevea brasiliensis]|uniref:Uncharacterized protein n=1 Tax=Hevea brasiliensis TaxID=3981 RepID=A0A6A6MUQ9_HEVBR|nr:hypothetical protein GH714_040821 [Hevea brasiliensis]
MVTGKRPKKPIDLIPLPIDARPSIDADTFGKHMCDINDEIRIRIGSSNAGYKVTADLRCKSVKYQGDIVMVHVKPKRFLIGISNIFNIEYLCIVDMMEIHTVMKLLLDSY